MATLHAPHLLSQEHDVSGFSSGEAVLDEWLAQRALENLTSGASRTYVLTEANTQTVIGFYALSMGQILSHDVPGSMRRNMPRNIPAVVLGRLAIDKRWQGQGLARALLFDAIHRAKRASTEIAARLVVVHAISETAEAFYRHHGFVRLPVAAPTLALDLVKFGKIAAG